MTESQYNELFVRLFESKLKTYSKITLKVWRDELKDIRDQDLVIAIKKAIQDDDNFPTTAKIIKLSQPDYEGIAQEIWNRALLSIKTQGDLRYLGKEEIKNIYKVCDDGFMRGCTNQYERSQMVKKFIEIYVESKQNNKLLEAK